MKVSSRRAVIFTVCPLLLAWGLLSLLAANADERKVVVYLDVTPSTGIHFKNNNSATPDKYLIETMTGGVGIFVWEVDVRILGAVIIGFRERVIHHLGPDRGGRLNVLFNEIGNGLGIDQAVRMMAGSFFDHD